MSPVKLIVLYHKSRKKSTKTGIGILGRVYSCDEIGRIVGNWRYTMAMSCIKIAGNWTKKNIPRNYHGMPDFTGGDEGIISLRCIAWQNLRIRANRRTPVRLFAAVRTLCPGFESTLSNTIKNHATRACFLLWRR